MSSSTGTKRTLDQDVSDMSKKVKMHEDKLDALRKELEKLERKRDLEKFIEIMSSDTCTLCSEDLIQCVGEIGGGIQSYKCDCSRQRIVHTKCWTREFQCSCGVKAVPHVCEGSRNLRKNVNSAYKYIKDAISYNGKNVYEEIRTMDFESYEKQMLEFFRDIGECNEIPEHLKSRVDFLRHETEQNKLALDDISGASVVVEDICEEVMSALALAKTGLSSNGEVFPTSLNRNYAPASESWFFTHDSDTESTVSA